MIKYHLNHNDRGINGLNIEMTSEETEMRYKMASQLSTWNLSISHRFALFVSRRSHFSSFFYGIDSLTKIQMVD